MPIRIERVERHQQAQNGLHRGGKEEIKTATTDVNVDKSNSKIQSSKGGRPPLIRVSFRNKEAAQAFCHLFKV